MPEPVHEGNLDDDAREAHIRERVEAVGPGTPSVLRFLLRRLDEARAERPPYLRRSDVSHYCEHDDGKAHLCICAANGDHVRPIVINLNNPPEETAPVRSAPASRARVARLVDKVTGAPCPASPVTLCTVSLREDHRHVMEHMWTPPAPVRVEVRPVIDATPRTPPLGHWWTCELTEAPPPWASLLLTREAVVSPLCVVPGCGLGPEAHE